MSALSKSQAEFCMSMGFLFWWKKPEELALSPLRTLAGVMARGGVREWRDMERLFPASMLIRTPETAVCGEFESWSWRFWRMRLGLDADAPLPARLPGMPPPKGEPWFKALQRKRNAPDTSDPGQRLTWLMKLRRRQCP